MQSSNFENNGIQYTADRAIDGKRNIEAFEPPYISSTKGEFRNPLLQGFSNCGPRACCRWSASTMGKKEKSGDVFILERKIIYNNVLKITNCNQSFLNT